MRTPASTQVLPGNYFPLFALQAIVTRVLLPRRIFLRLRVDPARATKGWGAPYLPSFGILTAANELEVVRNPLMPKQPTHTQAQ